MASAALQPSQSLEGGGERVGTARRFCFQADPGAWEVGTHWWPPELIREFPGEAQVTTPQKVCPDG